MLKTMIFTELKSLKSKFVIIQIFIMTIGIIIPFVFISGSNLSGLNINNFPPEFKSKVLEGFDNIFYFRISLSFYLYICWMFIPKLFYGKKINGEIESIISMGYSAKKIWMGKSLATILAVYICAFPLFVAFMVIFKWYIYTKYSFITIYNPIGFLFLLLINPIIIFFMTLIIGGIQLITDDYMKSSFAIFIINFANFFTLSYIKNLYHQQIQMVFLFVSIGVILVLAIAGTFYSKKVLNENLIISMHKDKSIFSKLKKLSENN